LDQSAKLDRHAGFPRIVGSASPKRSTWDMDCATMTMWIWMTIVVVVVVAFEIACC